MGTTHFRWGPCRIRLCQHALANKLGCQFRALAVPPAQTTTSLVRPRRCLATSLRLETHAVHAASPLCTADDFQGRSHPCLRCLL